MTATALPLTETETPGPETLVALLARAREVPGTGLRLLDRRERESFLEWSEIHRRAGEVGAALQQLAQPRDRLFGQHGLAHIRDHSTTRRPRWRGRSAGRSRPGEGATPAG